MHLQLIVSFVVTFKKQNIDLYYLASPLPRKFSHFVKKKKCGISEKAPLKNKNLILKILILH